MAYASKRITEVSDTVTEAVKRDDVKTLDDLDKVIKEFYPDGLSKARDKNHLDGGAYIGFNLRRYAYKERTAAELHALRDTFIGTTGRLYWNEFSPFVERHESDDGDVWYELWTG